MLGTGLALAPVAAAPLHAAQDDPRLEPLVAAIWLDSGRPEIDVLMREGRQYLVDGEFY